MAGRTAYAVYVLQGTVVYLNNQPKRATYKTQKAATAAFCIEWYTSVI
jgi:hypothetical protein